MDKRKPLKYALKRLRRARVQHSYTSQDIVLSNHINSSRHTTHQQLTHKQQQSQSQSQQQRQQQLNYNEYRRQLLAQHYDASEVDVDATIINVTMANVQNNDTKPLTQSLLTQKPRIQPKYDVHRDVLTHEVVIKETGYVARDNSIPHAICRCCRQWSFFNMFAGVLPLLQWLPKYSLKRDLTGDLIAGFTVAIMHIPHGMAYGILAGVAPSNGMYMAVFPVLAYIVLGTSKHISMGTFSVISMMTLKVVQNFATDEALIVAAARAANATGSAATTAALPYGRIITPMEVVTTLALGTAIVHFIMSFFRLGMLSSLLSEPLVNGFTTGAAVHVVTAQLKEILGVSVPRYKGAFKIVRTVVAVLWEIPNTNVVVLVFCVAIIIFMTLCNELLKPWLRKCCRMPFPAELVAVIGGTLISIYCDLNANYNVALVGNIPSGLPAPEFPSVKLLPDMVGDSIAIAVVSFSIVMSMGLMFAKKHAYEVRPNQELFAMGMGNLVAGCFAGFPLSCSLSRSLIQEQTGGATQLASLVAAGLIVITLLWAGPFFSNLPRCVLAGVIIVALKPMFMQATQMRKFARQGKLEVFTWLVTFLSVVIIDIDIGLLIGIALSLLALYIKGIKPYSSLLGVIAGAPAVYVDMNNHRNATQIPELRIFRYTGSVNFATGRFFRNVLYEKLGFTTTTKKRRAQRQLPPSPPPPTPPPQQEPQQQLRSDGTPMYMPIEQNGETMKSESPPTNGIQLPTISADYDAAGNDFRFLILDLSMLGHIDMAGCGTFSEILRDMGLRGIRIIISAPTDRVYEALVHSMVLGEGPFEIFPTLHDAVVYAVALRDI